MSKVSTQLKELAAHLAGLRLTAHLSLSDETDAALAFVILEQR